MGSITKEIIKSIQADLNALNKKYQDTHGISICWNGVRYSEYEFSIKLQGCLGIGDDAQYEADFKKSYKKLGFSDMSIIGRKVEIKLKDRVEVAVIVGSKATSKAYPIVCKSNDGEYIKVGLNTVTSQLNPPMLISESGEVDFMAFIKGI